MTRPIIQAISSTNEGWDAFVDSNFNRIAGTGTSVAFPLVRFGTIGALPTPSANNECIATVTDDGVWENTGAEGWVSLSRRIGTTERAIGRIDPDTANEVFYEKLVKSATLATGAVNVAHGITSPVHIFLAMAKATEAGGDEITIPLATATDADVIQVVGIDGTNIKLDVGTNWTGGAALTDAWFILRYTK